MGDILTRLIDRLGKENADTFPESIVDEISLGVVYSGARIGNHGGVAATQIPQSAHCETLSSAGKMHDVPLPWVLEMGESSNSLKRTVATSALNAFIKKAGEEISSYESSNTSVSDIIKNNDRVAMVGHFAPMIPGILKKASTLYVAEKRPIKDERITIVPEEELKETIASSDVAIITGTTLLNNSLDPLMKSVSQASNAILLGPTTPLYPDLFFEEGFNAVMGTKIDDASTMLRIVSQAGGTKQIHKNCGTKISFVQ
ncbi:Rossmann-like domain-containing protein [Methanohalophilus sp.]